MEFLHELASNTQVPVLAALLLGLITAISPCPLATNITAVGFISRQIENKKKILINGLLYTLGRSISYSLLGLVLIILLKQGISTFKIQRAISTYGELLIGPFLLIIGILMLEVIPLRLSLLQRLTSRMQEKDPRGSQWQSLLLGMVFALAFCPYSGVLYFGVLIPLSVNAANGFILPLFFAVATALPVILFAWLLAYSIAGIARTYNRIQLFGIWFRKLVGLIFIGTGLYYMWIIYIK